MIEQNVTRIAHLQSTSEADQVPCAWAVAEVNRVVAALPAAERDSAMLNGWRGVSISYTHRRTDLEVVQGRLALLLAGVRPGMTEDEVAELLKQAGG